MTLCLCVDKNNGMMFFGKRQSQDRIQREQMLQLVGNHTLWVSNYSKTLFDGIKNVIADDDFFRKITTDDFCFVEDLPIELSSCSSVILYHWNRDYPATAFFEVDLKKEGFKLTSKRHFCGSSHEKITEEIYKRITK